MKDVKVCVLRIEGTNCEDEAAQAFASVGASPEKVHLKQLLGQCPSDLRRDLGSYDILMLPGGFSAGDYVRAGAIFAARMKSGLKNEIVRFVEDGKPVLGVCNGFQILVELGLLPAMDETMSEAPEAALYTNDSGRFECRPTLLRMEKRQRSVFTSNIPNGSVLMYPSAHAEGKLMFPHSRQSKMLKRLLDNDQVMFRYVDPEGEYAGYPWCPNGSLYNIAGICNPAGNVLGMMPHPERVLKRETHPDWTRAKRKEDGDGLSIFRSAVKSVK
ncbi:MAG TPA: phosphoribosylformylglycinamidine synthase subunit PurQ [Methanomassiliicoccales archaeon]|nr:phosphoribosylformylglycinamidine synthase subunit PurQ [Methanomassiliicoccales archaeon]HPR98662.1 phosphoribosylformylglycinamidine synthase subunit PurQ [Methanomassiliicoccales archaeon]